MESKDFFNKGSLSPSGETFLLLEPADAIKGDEEGAMSAGSAEAAVESVQLLGGDLDSSIWWEKPKETARSRKSSITKCEALSALTII